MNIALIGTGQWGKVLLRNMTEKFKDELNVSRYASSGKPDNINWMTLNYPSIQRASFETILADPDIEAVVIATPIKTHFSLTLKAIQAGKHVFVEKPLALSDSGAKLIRREAQAKDITVLIDYIYVYHVWAEHLKKILSGQASLSAYFHWRKFGTFQENIVDNLLSHEVAIAVHLFGGCTNVESIIIDEEKNVLSLLASFRNCNCKINIDRLSHIKDKRVRISSGNDTYDWNGDFLNGAYLNPNSHGGSPLEKAFGHFIECVKKNEEPITGPTFEIKVASCLEEIRQKLKTPSSV